VEIVTPRWEPRPARVLLAERAASATLASAGRYTLTPGDTPAGAITALLDQGAQLGESIIRPGPTGTSIGARTFPQSALLVSSDTDGSLSVNGVRYRGQILIRRVAPDQLSVLNLIPLEPYLYSVLGSESFGSWPDAALEAQAVIARSYALWRIATRRGEPYDLVATVMDQNYAGLAKENARFRTIVDRTEGLVLLYQLKLFRCYYHSACGGHTDAVENLFPDPPLAPLSGVACAYCKASPRYRWQCEISKNDLAEALRKTGTPMNRLASLEAVSRTTAGRVLDLAIESDTGFRTTLRAADFRMRVGPQKLPSTWFDVHDRGKALEFRGRGMGHGVGLCQWGSKGMAELGYSAQAILGRYYPGATLHRLYRGKDYVQTESAPASGAAGNGATP
jgi:stage II sporulation protein D